ncbi:MAG: DUF1003 domain-containing protein [Kofleriaceae bacterium]
MADPDSVNDPTAILELGEREIQAISAHQLAIEKFIHTVATPATFYCLLSVCVAWVVTNLTMHRAFDREPFPILQGIIAIYAAAIATCVLIAQGREKAEADRRAKLQLHVNLIAEQKATKIISLLEELRRDLPNVRDRRDEIAERLQHEVDAAALHAALASETPNKDEH